MFRCSAVYLREPLIRFRYAVTKNGGVPFQWAPTVTAAVASATPNVFDSFDQLPPHLRPRQFKEDEMEIIMMGGVEPYELKKKKRS